MSRLDNDIRVVVSIELSDKPFLSEGLEYKKVITDYLGKLAEMVKISCVSKWQNLGFYRQVLTIFTVPAEFDDDAISTMREYHAFTAELTKDKFSRNLKFATEPEAVAIYCLNSMKGQYNLSTGDVLKSFQSYDIDLDDHKLIKQYVTAGEEKNRLEEADWLIEIEFEDIKAMFDPVIRRIIRLIRGQLEKRNKKCSALMLTGVFNKSRYLQARIRQEFGVPIHPIIAIGVQFGLQEEKMHIVFYENLKHLIIGTDIARASQSDDPASEKFPNDLSIIFDALTKRGEQVPIELPKNEDIEDMEDIIILFTLSFGSVEVLATAENQKN
ncbi:6588_t:CDS:2, partial [Rhizophagus irregularis]